MRLLPDLVLTPQGWLIDRAVAVTEGRIVAIQDPGPPQRGDVALPGRALLPGTVNSHCHTFQSLLRGLGDDLDFMGWRDRVLYPFLDEVRAVDLLIDGLFDVPVADEVAVIVAGPEIGLGQQVADIDELRRQLLLVLYEP